jgi:hypothetical protein
VPEPSDLAAVLAEQAEEVQPSIDVAHLEHQREWSRATFGPDARTLGVLDHIREELDEIEAAPHDVEEWADLLILAFDGAWRAGHEPADIIAAVKAKQQRNERRAWPDWRTRSSDHKIKALADQPEREEPDTV